MPTHRTRLSQTKETGTAQTQTSPCIHHCLSCSQRNFLQRAAPFCPLHYMLVKAFLDTVHDVFSDLLNPIFYRRHNLVSGRQKHGQGQVFDYVKNNTKSENKNNTKTKCRQPNSKTNHTYNSALFPSTTSPPSSDSSSGSSESSTSIN